MTAVVRRMLRLGKHARYECVARPGEWCRAIGNHPGACAACPSKAAAR